MTNKTRGTKPQTNLPKLRDEDSFRRYIKERALASGNRKSDPKTGAFLFYMHCLGDQAQTIKEILRLIRRAGRVKEQTLFQLNGMDKLSADFNDIQEEQRLKDKVIANEEIQDAFAGTLFVILNSLLRSMTNRIEQHGGAKPPVVAGRRIGETSIFELIRSISNNFRHFEEWNKGDARQAANIKVLQAAGLKGPWDRNRSGDVFEIIGWKREATLSREMRQLVVDLWRAQTGRVLKP